jgi:hypothetical protein
MTKSTLSRWLTENVADTRTSDGPDSRLYAAPFAEVWDSLVDSAHRRRGWKLIHADEELGLMRLTRVEARSESRVGRGDLGMNRRRIERLLSRLDRTVGPAVRV